jgi:hypothetical protein
MLAAMVACSSPRPAPGAPASRVVGTVTAGPVTPVARPGTPNSRPLPGVTVEAVRDGAVAAAARSDDRGRYRLTVDPGSYLIRVEAPGRFLSRHPGETVTVSPGETVTVNFPLDTGIR